MTYLDLSAPTWTSAKGGTGFQPATFHPCGRPIPSVQSSTRIFLMLFHVKTCCLRPFLKSRIVISCYFRCFFWFGQLGPGLKPLTGLSLDLPQSASFPLFRSCRAAVQRRRVLLLPFAALSKITPREPVRSGPAVRSYNRLCRSGQPPANRF